MWKTSDPELDRRLRRSFADGKPRFQRPLAMEAHGLAGKPLTIIARDESGHVVRVEAAAPLARAENQPLTTGRLREQLGRLIHVPNTWHTEPQALWAQALSERSFGGQAFFCNSGTEANEAAIKLARLHNAARHR